MNVFDKIMRIPGNKYREKDAKKFTKITKFIGRGSWVSSTHKYAQVLNGIANTGEYSHQDTVGVSVEGNRNNRQPLDEAELMKAIQAKATIITDTLADRRRSYNVGEREASAFLKANGYKEYLGTGTWDHEERWL
jgi:hypothetical protein